MSINLKNHVLVLLVTLACTLKSAGQRAESTEFEQKKYNTFSSQGHSKNRGLNFSIAYPTTYVAEEAENPNIVKVFIHETYNLTYMVGVIESPTPITKDLERIVLSEEHLKQSIVAIKGNYSMLGYKKGFKISGMKSAYLEYFADISKDTKNYTRQYFSVYKNYVFSVVFSVTKLRNETIEEAKTRFDAYKSFFNLAANTLEVVD